jgi:hypothetical protein
MWKNARWKVEGNKQRKKRRSERWVEVRKKD